MNINIKLAIFCLSIILFQTTNTIAVNKKYTYLILGTKSPHLNELQDRLLRERNIYNILKMKHNIVPIMKIEAVIQENKINIRGCSSKTIQELTYKFNADFTLTGELKYNKNKLYYFLIIYAKKNNKFYSKKIIIEENLIFQKYCDKLSNQIILESLKLTQKKGS